MAEPAENEAFSDSGGFFQNDSGLWSPVPGQAAPSARSSSALGLPHPRRQPLRPGSAKEDLVRRYVGDRLLQISRRFVKKHSIAQPGDTVVGYQSMGDLCRDVDALLNDLWKSGTRTFSPDPFFLSLSVSLAPRLVPGHHC